MPNRLAAESSPYLVQHADNPVDWYPWGEEPFAHARERDVPVFLSIGYSACHWCHVMERESFTDPETAAYLNTHFVCVKVDREERPDIDAIYMQAVTALTGQGGWPLSAWLTPDGAPFHAGTYYPPRPSFGRPSFRQVLEAIRGVWSTRREELHSAARQIVEHLGRDAGSQRQGIPRAQVLAGATKDLLEQADRAQGGWGPAPKFPQPLVLDYLLADHSLSPNRPVDETVTVTLDAMAAGGIYDQLGGGFHRYSTDDVWLVPHFEKMLYDNAQLARCYLHAWQATGRSHYRRIVEETLDYLLRRMRHPSGGFYSAEDADSEGREGVYYVWTAQQMRHVLGETRSKQAEAAYGVSARGNFEGANILHLPAGPNGADTVPAAVRSTLLSAREQRIPPARDEKVLTAWNGITLAVLAEAARAFGSERLREAAVSAGEFMTRELVHDSSRLYHSWKDGVASVNGFLDDYACLVEGLLALYQATHNERWFEAARELADAMIEHFRRPAGGFYDTSDDHESLIIRPRTLQDSPTPSGSAMAATVLIKIAAYTGEAAYSDAAEDTLASSGVIVHRAPVMAGQWLTANLLAETGLTEVAVVGDLAGPAAKGMLAVIEATFRPTVVSAARPAGAASVLPLLQHREPGPSAEAAAWVCRASSCTAPVEDPGGLESLLG